MRKKLLLMIILLISSFSLYGCFPEKTPEKETDTNMPAEQEVKAEDEMTADDNGAENFTLEELAEYDGLDGNRAYVAIDGIVYDITDSSYWNEGSDKRFEAGKDVSDQIPDVSPEFITNTKGIEKKGKLTDK